MNQKSRGVLPGTIYYGLALSPIFTGHDSVQNHQTVEIGPYSYKTKMSNTAVIDYLSTKKQVIFCGKSRPNQTVWNMKSYQ